MGVLIAFLNTGLVLLFVGFLLHSPLRQAWRFIKLRAVACTPGGCTDGTADYAPAMLVGDSWAESGHAELADLGLNAGAVVADVPDPTSAESSIAPRLPPACAGRPDEQ